MAFTFKKYAALTTALVCTMSLAGCADSGYMGTVEDIQIRNGIYLSNMMAAYETGYSNIIEAKDELGDTTEVTDIFAEQIDGVSAEEWIKAETIDLTKRYVAVEKLFAEKGLELDEKDVKSVTESVNKSWEADVVNYYGMQLPVETIYGYPTMGEYYEAIGIGKETLKDMELNKMKENELLVEIYTNEEGKKVPEEEINTYLKNNYANVKFIEVPYKNYEGLSLDAEEDAAEIKALKDRVKSYVDRFNGGESIIELVYEQDLIDAQNDAIIDAEDALEAEDAEIPDDYDAYIEDAKNSATAEKAESIEELETIISKESSPLAKELTEFVWKTAEDGKAYYLEGEKAAYLVIREDITTKEQWKENNMVYILSKLTDDSFDEYLEGVYADYSVEFDQQLINKYAPSSYKGFKINV